MTKPKDNARPGRTSIFRDKAGGDRVQGNITAAGSVRFEQARRRLAKLAGCEYEDVSDADTIEFLARGEGETIKALQQPA
jgi:hypothetical protein